MEKEFISYDKIQSLINIVVSKLQDEYDCIVGVSRGGLIPATLVGYKLYKPVYSFGVATYKDTTQTGECNIYQHLPKLAKSRVLVVDDICDTGNTFDIIKKLYKHNNGISRLDFMSVFVREGREHLVDYYGVVVPEGIWMDFPWG